VGIASAVLAAVGSAGITASATWSRSWRAKSKQERREAWRRLRVQIGKQLLRLGALTGRLLSWLGAQLWWLVVVIVQRLAARIREPRRPRAHIREEQHPRVRVRIRKRQRLEEQQHRERQRWEE
jgi:hypothetical protein